MMKIFIQADADGILQGWGSTRGHETDIEVEVADNHPILFSNHRLFRYVDGQIIKGIDLELAKEKGKKALELNKACKNAILSGFDYIIDGVEYHFSFDQEAQMNFQGAKEVLNDGLVQEIMWTVKQNGEYTRIPVTKALMAELTVAILQHKDNNISKYRDFLMPMVNGSTTVEEIQSVTW